MEKTIQSISIHPRDGVAWPRRRYSQEYPPVGEPWPELSVGDSVRIEDNQGWIWSAWVTEITDTEAIKVKVKGEPEAQPFPDPDENGVLTLPHISGHAHSRAWGRGDIVWVNGSYYKVTKKPKNPRPGVIRYELQESTEEEYRKRPGRISMRSEAEANEAVGSAVQTGSGEWLHIKKVTRSSFHGALGRDYVYWGRGRHVTAERAARLNEVHAPSIAMELRAYRGERTPDDKFPSEAGEPVVLIPGNPNRVTPSGERVAIDGGTIYHERCGDPDMADIWRRYVVQIVAEPELTRRVIRFIKKGQRKKR